jgi:hypothetical protein
MRTRGFFEASGVLLALLLLSGPASAEPALWVTRSGTATVYLFGTLHLLKGNESWRSEKMERALAATQDLWLELADISKDTVTPLLMRYAVDRVHPLSSVLSDDERLRLDAIARRLGLDGLGALNSFRPWWAGVVISMAQDNRAGYDPRNGVEQVLRARMAEAGKPIRGLETLEEQIRFFIGLDRPTELQMLREAMDEIDAGPARLGATVTAWLAGDVDVLADITAGDFRDEPAAYQALLVDRNVAWAARIQDRLRGTGVSFIAVGAAHLAGADSVQVQLARRGIRSERE